MATTLQHEGTQQEKGFLHRSRLLLDDEERPDLLDLIERHGQGHCQFFDLSFWRRKKRVPFALLLLAWFYGILSMMDE